MPHSNRYFSARELRIFFRNTNCTNYTNKLLSLERFVFNTQYYSFKSHTDLTDLFFSLQATGILIWSQWKNSEGVEIREIREIRVEKFNI